MSRTQRVLYQLAGLTSFLIIWEIAGRMSVANGLLPPFTTTFEHMAARILDGSFIEHGVATLSRTYTGFAVAAMLGVSTGLVIGWSRKAQDFFDFLIDFLRNVSSITLIPITILIVGIGFQQKIIVLAYAAYFPVVLNTINGVATTDRSKIEAAKAMGATDMDVIRHVVVYSALPSIFTGLRLAMGVAFVVVIAAELVGATSGLGWYLHEASRTYEIANMFAAALFVSILGYLSSKLIVATENSIITWKDSVADT